MTDHSNLKRLAEAAQLDGPFDPRVCMTKGEIDFAAAANPAAVLGLLDEVERLQADGASMRGSLKASAAMLKKAIKEGGRVQRERDQLKSENEALRRAVQHMPRLNPLMFSGEFMLGYERGIADAVVAIDAAMSKEAGRG